VGKILLRRSISLTVLIGFPIGSGYLRLDSAASGYIDAQPHNEIVNQYLRVGVFGTILLILFTVRPIYIYFREPTQDLCCIRPRRHGSW